MTVKVSTGVQGPTGAPGLGFPLAPVTVLPGSPTDGQIVLFQSGAMATAGVMWMLRYRAAGGTYKWEFLGGSPIYAAADANANMTTLSAFTDFADAVPTITIPLAGDYIIDFTARLSHTGTGQGALVAPAATGLVASNANSAFLGQAGTTNGTLADLGRKILGTAISGTLKLQYFVGASGGTASSRRLALTPVRVG